MILSVPYLPAVIDVETNKIADFSRPADDPDQPRVAALCMIMLDTSLAIVDSYSVLIRPDGWSMTAGATATNNLTDEDLREKGVPISEALDRYTKAIDAGYVMVAHNARFDLKIMRGELRRAGRDDMFDRTKNICIMRAATGICCIPAKRGGYKWPSLDESFEFFHGFKPDGAHTASGDAYSAVEILRSLVERGAYLEPAIHPAKDRAP